MPRGTNAPKLCPADPVKCTWIVSSGSPSLPYLRVTSEPSIVPTVRCSLRIGRRISTGSRRSSAADASEMSVVVQRLGQPVILRPHRSPRRVGRQSG